jgi:hypothetical protein
MHYECVSTPDGFKLNNKHQLLVCIDHNLLGKGMNAIKKITEDSLIASKMAGLEVSKLC